MNVGALVSAVVLLLANGYFVAVEFALIASRRTGLETLAEEGDARAGIALKASRELSLQLAGAQLGITAASLGLGAVAEPAVASIIEDVLGVGDVLPHGATHALAFTIALGIVVYLHMVVGEMIPKNLAIANPEGTMLRLARSNQAYVTLFRPVIRVLNAVANGLTRLVGVEPRDELATVHTADEIASLLAASREEGLIEEVAHELLTGALDFGRRRVADVAVPRDRLTTVAQDATVAEAERAAVASGHSRLLVTGVGGDELIGFVHVKDLLTVAPEARDRPLPLGRIRRVLVVDASLALDDVVVAMRRARTHVAVVVAGEARPGHAAWTVGLATLEDVLEALVGDIRDETDRSPGPTL